MENNNVSIGTIQKVLGHENRATTEIYLHSIGNAERIALDIYEAARKSLTQIHTRSGQGVSPQRANPLILLVRQPRFELGTYGLEGRCSIQLSYWRIMMLTHKR